MFYFHHAASAEPLGQKDLSRIHDSVPGNKPGISTQFKGEIFSSRGYFRGVKENILRRYVSVEVGDFEVWCEMNDAALTYYEGVKNGSPMKISGIIEEYETALLFDVPGSLRLSKSSCEVE